MASTIYKWPLSDLPRSTLCPSLSLSFTKMFRSRVREKKRRKIKYLIMIIKCKMFCQMYIVFIVYLFDFVSHDINNDFCCKIQNFHCTYDGEPREKSHGASNRWHYVHKLCCSVFGDSVKCWGVEVDPHKSQLISPFKCWCNNEWELWVSNKYKLFEKTFHFWGKLCPSCVIFVGGNLTGNELFQVLFWFRFGEACKDEAGAGRQALGLEILHSYILHAVQLWDGAQRFLQIDSI